MVENKKPAYLTNKSYFGTLRCTGMHFVESELPLPQDARRLHPIMDSKGHQLELRRFIRTLEKSQPKMIWPN